MKKISAQVKSLVMISELPYDVLDFGPKPPNLQQDQKICNIVLSASPQHQQVFIISG